MKMTSMQESVLSAISSKFIPEKVSLEQYCAAMCVSEEVVEFRATLGDWEEGAHYESDISGTKILLTNVHPWLIKHSLLSRSCPSFYSSSWELDTLLAISNKTVSLETFMEKTDVHYMNVMTRLQCQEWKLGEHILMSFSNEVTSSGFFINVEAVSEWAKNDIKRYQNLMKSEGTSA